ncbi:hemerythrin domain-containing protein [Roseateles sp. NT4]|uniref:hemerythrin domain-containing protein n=1 Tax=Roseateles sp. NT4 TaxID=3453715 RepID=UPI003EEF3BF4
MPTTTKTSAKASKDASTPKPAARKTSTRSKADATPNAIDLLIADHKEVKALFKDYDKLVKSEAQTEDKQTIALQICTMLTAHATVEEELFYPAARRVLGKDEDLVDEADVEHASCKELIAQIEEGAPDDPLYDAKVKVLGEYIDHHVKEEEGEMFPKVRKSDLDLDALGEDMADRKAELLGEDAEKH